MVSRGGHRVLSAASKAKISASLRGNKNAFRGGPKKQRLTSREKVANINARTKANKLNLSDAQLRQRSAVAKRLRARARAEESGIKPAHSKPIPTPSTIENRDSKLRADSARAKGSIAKVEQKSAGHNSQFNADKFASEFDAANRKTKPGALVGTPKSSRSAAMKQRVAEVNAMQAAKRTAMAREGKGNFNSTQNRNDRVQGQIDRNNALVDMRRKQISESQDETKIAGWRSEINSAKSANADLRNKLRSDRSKPSTDPLTKATSKPAPMANSKISADRRAGEAIQAKQVKAATAHKKNQVTKQRQAAAVQKARPLQSPKANSQKERTNLSGAINRVSNKRGFVNLTEVRKHLKGSSEEQNKAIVAAHMSGQVVLSPESSNLRHTPAFKNGAIKIGRNEYHLVALND